MNIFKKKTSESQFLKVAEAIDFAKKLMDNRANGAEAFMLSFHVVKDGKIHHYFDYEAFPNGDWGACMIAMAQEAKKAELTSHTGKTKITDILDE